MFITKIYHKILNWLIIKLEEYGDTEHIRNLYDEHISPD